MSHPIVIRKKTEYALVIGIIICLGLLIAWIIHPLVFPPTRNWVATEYVGELLIIEYDQGFGGQVKKTTLTFNNEKFSLPTYLVLEVGKTYTITYELDIFSGEKRHIELIH